MIFEIKLLEEKPAQIFSFVGADCERRALAREAFQRCDGTRIWTTFPRYVRLLVDQELGEHLVEIVGSSEPAQGLLDHDANAEPYARPHGCG
jgi:hypothetical protein